MPSLKFEEAMEDEHCRRKDKEVEFTTGNYNITTFPYKEWMFVVEQKYEEKDLTHGRRVRDIDALLEQHNKVVPNGGAKLTRAEVIAVVLYTGPMVRAITFRIRSQLINLAVPVSGVQLSSPPIP